MRIATCTMQKATRSRSTSCELLGVLVATTTRCRVSTAASFGHGPATCNKAVRLQLEWPASIGLNVFRVASSFQRHSTSPPPSSHQHRRHCHPRCCGWIVHYGTMGLSYYIALAMFVLGIVTLVHSVFTAFKRRVVRYTYNHTALAGLSHTHSHTHVLIDDVVG
jgi:hypothetical protein